MTRRFTASDRVVDQFDTLLRTLVPGASRASRACPGSAREDTPMSSDERHRSVEVLRYYHRARIVGQGIYQGQRLASAPVSHYQPIDALSVRGVDQLAWCELRLASLDSGPPRLAPLYYLGGLGVGFASGRRGVASGLGLVHHSEQQLADLLARQIGEVASADRSSAELSRRMLEDDTRHARCALEGGGRQWPQPLGWALSLAGRLHQRIRLRQGGSPVG
ncbi:3-demethoxyubiquinol 3-hydroxylase [Kushneria aurantia]|uniref:Demethoxyubiquinone hydroxylase family protein n=1 Tax=Kushneria aurantia TaxID=504092 RepID=A0ABV6G5K8_9GAMM|nr:demethoxyubiquinone hydroxylase family protein [Kushneria aurantia]